MTDEFEARAVMDARGFVLLGDYVPGIVQEIRYYTTFNFVGDRINGYEEPCAITTIEAARALQAVNNELNVQGFRLKVFDAYRPVTAVKHFTLWGVDDLDLRMKFSVILPVSRKVIRVDPTITPLLGLDNNGNPFS